MDVFAVHEQLVSDYRSFTSGSVEVRDPRIKAHVDEQLDEGIQWPDPWLSLNPSFESGGAITQLVNAGLLDQECERVFRVKADKDDPGSTTVTLHKHQREAIEVASSGSSYVLTTGTGSGKSLAYIVPIVDNILRERAASGGQRSPGVKAIVVYPMNALANSQLLELEKFLKFGYPTDGEPVRFARYTGQEGDETRRQILADPPDILLTNYVMLELVLTRPDERKHLIRAAHELRFLVLDEMHTYRGRQGADVALLIRRLRDACASPNLQIVGTSATMASGGTRDEQKATVAEVATRLFGSEVWGVELDKRSRGVAGAAERAPHAMVQELLNRTDDYLWAAVANGRTLRLLRDSSSLSGQSYVEFDLESMFDGEVFSDFAVMFLLLHQSRVEILSPDGPASDCWLERWRTASIESATRALGLLRGGVQSALEVLGTGFLQHPANTDLRSRLEAKELSLEDYHRSLLRLVYRLLFLFVAEDRQALLTADAEPVAKARYADYFSTARLRALSHKRRGTRHGDLWEGLSLVIASLGNEDGCPELALPGIGGLFDHGPADVPTGQSLPNDALLAAIRNLSVVQPKGQPQRPVDYRNLGAEELGSIYESLLELIPRHDSVEQTFTLESLAGNERKTTGSYYTPTSLIDLVLDEALDPLLDDAEKSDNPAEALQALTICDPACGSGHFLVAAARRIADRLAVVRTGDVDPTPTDQQSAMYDVVAKCIYGVDVNPMAAELAKVSLWLEAIQPGRPLTFLDAHIKIGNALIGTTPALLRTHIPDAAYGVIEGDDKKYAAVLKKQNRLERDAGQSALFGANEAVGVSNRGLREQLAKARAGAVTSLADAHEAQRRYAGYLASPELDRAQLLSNAWCAAFVQVKQPDSVAITDDSLRAIEDGSVSDEVVADVTDLAVRYRFFHWHLEFPDVFDVPDAGAATPTGWRGGFTAMLGNPPWERVKLQEQEFFAARNADIATAPNAAARRKLIAKLETEHPELHADFLAARRRAEGESALLRTSGRYPLTGRGDVNTYAVFAETFRDLTGPQGRSGVIVPTGIATDATTQYFFRDLVERGSLAALYDFENAAPVFEGVHRSFKFCILTIAGADNREPAAKFAFFLHDPSAAPTSRFEMTPEEIALLNPNTGTCPIFRTRRDAEITLGIYRRVPVLVREGDPDGNPWGVSFMRMFDMSNDSHLFHTREQLEADGWTLNGNVFESEREVERMMPLYEAKMLHQFDHRWATYDGLGTRDVTAAEKADPSFVVLPRYWVMESEVENSLKNRWDRAWLLGWRDIARTTDERTVIAALAPRVGVGHKMPVLTSDAAHLVYLQMNSVVFDYVARQKIGGTSVTYFYMKRLPALDPAILHRGAPWASHLPLQDWLTAREAELTNTARDMRGFAEDLDDHGAPFMWDDERRAVLRAELDAAFFHLYGVERDDVEYILDTFPIVRRKDEARFGEFRTKLLILETYDALARASATGEPFVSRLDPPPGQGRRHPAKEVTR